MRIKKLIALAICVFPFLLSCRTEEGELTRTARSGKDEAPVTFCLDAADVCYATRSATVSDESGIRDVNLFLYRGGKLEWQEYRSSGEDFSLNLLAGQTYSAYALANAGRLDAPSVEAQIHSYSLDLPSSAAAGKIPMATLSGVSFTVPAGGAASTVELLLTRLVAKYNFCVDRSGLQYGSFTVSSVRVRQAARRVGAFLSGSAASSDDQVADGDYASGADLSRLNADAAIRFYLPENAQGTLLEGNTDPWRKEYFDPAVSAKAPLCSYLEVTGRYCDHSGGLGATHTYRMFLGEDATTNFDVLRNTEYTLTLSVTDLGAFRDSWKVERGDVTDSRTLRFEPAVLEIPSLGSGVTAVVCNPSGVDYTLEWDAAAFSAAALGSPSQAGNQVTLTNVSELSSDATALLRAVSFDGALQAVCTLQVQSGVLPPLVPHWMGAAPAYVAQAGRVGFDGLTPGETLSAVSGDPFVARLVRDGDTYRVEALKEGSTTLTFSQTEGSRTRTGTLELTVAPVFLQVAGQSYRAFADGASNAVRNDGGGQEPWSLSYNLPRSAFDADLYAELLTPRYTAVRSGSSAAVDYFEVSEDGLYVVDWGSDFSALPGSYALALQPQAEIYATAREPLRRTVTVDAPVALSASVFEGENRYYLPDPGVAMSLQSTGSASLSLGSSTSLKLCAGFQTAGYGEGTGFVPCPYELTQEGGAAARLLLRPSYADLERFFPDPYRFRGPALYIFAQVTNARSGRKAVMQLGRTELWLALAVTAQLGRWPSASEWDLLDEDHYYLIPCLYDARFSPGFITFQSAQAGGGGDLSLPPFYLPQDLLTDVPAQVTLGGATIYLSETIPSGRTRPSYQVSDYARGLRCPNLTIWLADEAGFGEDDYDCESYQALSAQVGSWYHRKLYWRLRDPRSGARIPDGGHIDFAGHGGFSGNYYLRVYDYAEPLDPSDFDE